VTVKIQGITETLTSQINEMNESIQDSLNDSDLKSRLDSMGDNLDEMASDIEEIKSSVGDGSSSNYDISDIKSKVEEIHESVCDKYNYDSVARGIDDLLSAVNEMKDTAEYAKRAAEEAKDAAENAQRAAEEAKDAAESRL
jgi:methyl-accepting chemotaxis protein